MGMRKTAIVALMTIAWAGAPIQAGVSFAQPAPGAMAPEAMASSLSAADKDALMKKLQEAKKQNKFARKGYSTEPLTQAAFDKKILEINRLMDMLNTGQDFPLSRVDKAVKTPKSAL